MLRFKGNRLKASLLLFFLTLAITDAKGATTAKNRDRRYTSNRLLSKAAAEGAEIEKQAKETRQTKNTKNEKNSEESKKEYNEDLDGFKGCSKTKKCHKCSYGDSLSLKICKKTGYVEVYKCDDMKGIKKSCEHAKTVSRLYVFCLACWMALLTGLRFFYDYRSGVEKRIQEKVFTGK